MRYKSEETMKQIRNTIEEFYFANRRSPSISEIASEVGCARSTVHSYLHEMDKRGMISYDGKSCRPGVAATACRGGKYAGPGS